MRGLGETLSGRVEKVRGWLGIKAKKIVEEKSQNIFDTLSASSAPVDEHMGHTPIAENYPEQLHEAKVIPMHSETPENTSMAA